MRSSSVYVVFYPLENENTDRYDFPIDDCSQGRNTSPWPIRSYMNATIIAKKKKTFQHSLEIRKVANQRSKRLKAMDECLEEISNTECD